MQTSWGVLAYLNAHVLGEESAGKGDHEEKEAPYAGNLEKRISKEKKQKKCEIHLNKFLLHVYELFVATRLTT